ncbi:MAG: hypothetical protein ACAI35_11670 [Candidatus Methylacidiphilales bacterium]|nr:hypothetical protein [Candidatus Methylacidiphilales bacterium]
MGDFDPNWAGGPTAKEALRQSINTWICAQTTNDGVDGIIDFDAALRDPEKPTQMRAEYSGL